MRLGITMNRVRVALRLCCALGGLAGLGGLGGCAGPLVVSAGQTRGDQTLFAYKQVRTDHQGLIRCTTPEGHGDVQDCKHMTIDFED